MSDALTTNRMLIMLTTGPEDRGNRATLAFALGVSALISGVDVALYMTMSGTFWSREQSLTKVQIDGFDPLRTYVEQYRELGGKILVCSPCNEFYCSIASTAPLMEGAELCGLATVVDLSLGAAAITL